MELTHGFRVLYDGLRGPGTRLHVAPLLKLEHEAAVPDDGAGRQPLQDSLQATLTAERCKQQ